MNGVGNADFAMASITTKKNVHIPVETATSVVVIRPPSAGEEDAKKGTGTTTLDRMKDTETKTKDSDDQKDRTKLTEKQLTDKEPRENHSESKQTETMEEKALLTQVLMIPIIGVIAIHPIMTGETQTPGETRTPAATELEENKQAPPTDEICLANTLPYLTQSE